MQIPNSGDSIRKFQINIFKFILVSIVIAFVYFSIRQQGIFPAFGL